MAGEGKRIFLGEDREVLMNVQNKLGNIQAFKEALRGNLR